MTNEQIKEAISEMIPDEDILNRMVILEGDEFAGGVIGVSDDNRVVYSYEKLVQSLAEAYVADATSDIEQAEVDAVDWLEFNTIPSIPYMESQGLLAPIIVHEILF